MAVEHTFSENNDVLVITIKGVFDFSMLEDFRQAYSCDMGDVRKVVIDMRDTSSINSSALGMLLSMQRHLDAPDGSISIINCNKIVRKIFEITHFEKKFCIE